MKIRKNLLNSEKLKGFILYQQTLTKDVDENDTPFVALTIELKARLWTGDKKLTNGLIAKKFNQLVNTNELFDEIFKSSQK